MKQPVILLLSSLVVRGRVGLRAQSFALERLGFEPWLVPTVTLPFHPGHGPSHRITPSIEEFRRLLGDLESRSDLSQILGIVTGYLPGPDFAEPIAGLIGAVRSARPDVVITVDPVIGDERGLYVGEETACAIRDTLVPLATLATPNRFELAWLVDRNIDDVAATIDAARTLGSKMILVTTAHPMMRDAAANLLLSGTLALLAETPSIPAVPHGPGDLTAALMTANLLRGLAPDKALNRTTGAVHEVLAASAKSNADELALVTAQPFLDRPRTPVSIRILAEPTGRHGTRKALKPSSLT